MSEMNTRTLLALDGRGGREAVGVGGGAVRREAHAVTHSVIALSRADSPPIEGEQEVRA